jgi:GNAT superfamily N-acetyltransferase
LIRTSLPSSYLKKVIIIEFATIVFRIGNKPMDTLKIIRLQGKEIIPYIPNIANLRINIFKDYPYLYEGDLDYEFKYLNTYAQCAESIVILVFDKNNVVGASTAIPLQFETHEVKEPFLQAGMNIHDIFYFGESLLLPKYRGRNIYRQFFQEREQAARSFGCKIAVFAAVEREVNDPRKPIDYIPLDEVWKHFGYTKHPKLYTYFEWREIGEKSLTPKLLVFWLKTL